MKAFCRALILSVCLFCFGSAAFGETETETSCDAGSVCQ